MTSKHTPGPWFYRGPTGFVGTVKGSKMVASVYGDDPNCFEDGRQIANSLLIAAAPELLAAAKLALSIIGFGKEHDAISAAIARATEE